MAKLTKDQRLQRELNASTRMQENSKIDTLSEDQHQALSRMCAARHELHSNKPIICDNNRIMERLVLINIELNEVGIPCKSLPIYSDGYIDIDTMDYLLEDPDCPDSCDDEAAYQEFYNENYERISGEIEKLNEAIEDYLRDIDSKYGTSYCPTGAQRIM